MVERSWSWWTGQSLWKEKLVAEVEKPKRDDLSAPAPISFTVVPLFECWSVVGGKNREQTNFLNSDYREGRGGI